MVKKLVLVSLFGAFCCGLRAETQEEIMPLLQHVDLVLFLLEKNTVRMERYGLHELQSSVNVISKELSAEHSVFKIGMTEEKSKARDILWDLSQESRIKIIAGAKRTPKTYYLVFKKIVNPAICLEDCTMMCFDCAVNKTKIEPQDDSNAKPVWNSTLDIVVPVGEEKVAMQLIFNGKIEAACGLFVQNELFQGQIPVVGKLKREEALAQGVLITQKDAQRLFEKAQLLAAPVAASSPSTWSKVKAAFFNSLSTIKDFCKVSWQEVVGCFGAR